MDQLRSFDADHTMLTFDMGLSTLMWHWKTRILTLLLMMCGWLFTAVTAWITRVSYFIPIKTRIAYFQTPGRILCGGAMSWWLFMWTAFSTAFTLRVVICIREIHPFHTVNTLNWFTEGDSSTTEKTQSTSWMTLWNRAFPDHRISLINHPFNFIMPWRFSLAANNVRPVN